MIFEFGEYKLDIDVDRTHRFYETYETVDDSLGCNCAGCRNFRIVYSSIPDTVQGFFRQLGVDIGKPTELTAYNSSDGNLTFYDGFYHICGTILAGKDPWLQVGEGVYQLNEEYTLNLTNDFLVFFTEKCALVDPDFPTPVIQMEVRCNLPWGLDEPNPYHYPDL